MSKVAIITGGARGIGKDVALRLAKMGHNIVINHVSDSSQERAQKVIDKAKEEHGVDGLVVQGDVSDYDACKNIVESAVEKFGSNIAVLVNNAGIEKSGNFLEKTPEEYTNIINVNLLSPMHCSHLVLPYMIENEGGSIINMASIASYMALADDIDYSASKTGVMGLTRSLAMFGAPHGIRVNGVAPGLIETDMLASAPPEASEEIIQAIPLGKIGDVADISDCVEYLVTSEYITGQTICVSGGLVVD